MRTKKHYEKPAMQVFELRNQPQILAGSGDGGGMPGEIPGIPWDFF